MTKVTTIFAETGRMPEPVFGEVRAMQPLHQSGAPDVIPPEKAAVISARQLAAQKWMLKQAQRGFFGTDTAPAIP